MGIMGNLTPAERRVVELLALGMTQTRIAKVLCIEPATVYNHIKSARRKTGTGSAFQLAVKVAVATEIERSGR